jgi:PAS domain S-box-containing protein
MGIVFYFFILLILFNMADTEYTFESLEKKVKKLERENAELRTNNSSKSDQLNEVLKYSDMLVVNTTNDLRVMNHFGAADLVLERHSKNLLSGADLVKIIYQTTKNFYDKNSNSDSDDEVDYEKKIGHFLSTHKSEIQFKIVGKKDDGEIFLLIWDILKVSSSLRHFFRVLPTNTIVNEAKKFFAEQFEKQKELIKQIFNSVSDGVMYVDLSNKIKMVNDKAKEYFLTSSSKLMSRAQLEGKFFHEIFANETPDNITQRVEINNSVVINKEKIVYVMRTHGKKLTHSVLPWIDENNNVLGVMIIVSYYTKQEEKDIEEQKVDIAAIKNTLKSTLAQNSIMKERIKELEYNHNWLMKQRNDDNKTIKYYHSTIKNLYTYLDLLPYPLSILKLPDRIYDFVNKDFLEKFNLDKKGVLSKRDKEVFGPDAEQFLDSMYFKNRTTKLVVPFKNLNFKGRQIIVFDDSDTPKYLIRVYEK